MKNFYKKSQSGRSMVEMLGVLAIIGVLSVGGIAGYSKAMEKFKLQKAVDQISTIRANVQTLFSNTNDYSALNTKAYSLGVFPAEMAKKDGVENEVYNAYGLRTIVALFSSSLKSWTLSYRVPNAEVCTALATMAWGNDSSTMIVLDGGEASFNEFPIPLERAAAACSSAGQNPTDVQFIYR